MTQENVKNFMLSRGFKIALTIIGCLVVGLLIFQAGILVGYHRALFAHRGANSYIGVFENPGHGPFPEMSAAYPNTFGAIGKIVTISLPTIMVEDGNNTEKMIMTSPDTAVREFRQALSLSDLKVNDSVVIVGSPNDQGAIQAQLIRVMPATPASPSIGTTTLHY
ncbi:MAG: hypothetical protein KGI60_03880 [Patescibacteria group bacterium]|nr:hypothetical protein [Patescibacteria group bacterium]